MKLSRYKLIICTLIHYSFRFKIHFILDQDSNLEVRNTNPGSGSNLNYDVGLFINGFVLNSLFQPDRRPNLVKKRKVLN